MESSRNIEKKNWFKMKIDCNYFYVLRLVA